MTTETTKQEQVTTLGEYSGKFGKVAEELFRDSQRLLDLTPSQADKVCRQWQCDIGRVLAEQRAEGVKYGNTMSKSGELTLKEVTKSVKSTATNSLKIAATCQKLDEIRKFGAVKSYPEVELEQIIIEWLAK